jgi:phthalate 4,5-dioxygenase
MLSQEENDLITRVGPGTPAGDLLRRYWQPAALAEELPLDGAPVPVRMLGEDLVLFRDQEGRPGLLGIHCSHRGADLSYGRLEDGGLRCIYHGWLYDVAGRCLEQPGEPAGSTFHERIRHIAYPCREVGGMILAYLGPGEPPIVPAYEFLLADDEHRFNTKFFQNCNYVQGNEGNLDPTHNSWLHNFALDDNTEDGRPAIETEETDYGVRIYALRRSGSGSAALDETERYIKVTNFVLPNISTISGDRDGHAAHWHVPIDDTTHWKYHITFRRTNPVDQRARGGGRSPLTPDYRLRRNASNRYMQDRSEMKTSFSGIGRDFQAQDSCVIEGAGPIQDRTREHLGYSDRGIIASRKVLLRAIHDVQAGREPQHVVRDPEENRFLVTARADAIPTGMPWQSYWEQRLQRATRGS